MALYQAARRQSWYGESIGILILNASYPCVPGNVGNASTFPYPVRYKELTEVTIEGLIWDRDRSLVDFFVRAGQELQDEGVKAITGACGFMALFQREVAQALRVPVFLSSLMQLPFIHRMLREDQCIGVITADAGSLTDEHFSAVGVAPGTPIVIAGMDDQPEFSEAVMHEKGTLDSDKIEREVVGVARTLCNDHPNMGALLLECSDLPPYAYAVQRETGLPVFDFVTMISHVHSSVVRRPFDGWM
jgi:hypothetical protein